MSDEPRGLFGAIRNRLAPSANGKAVQPPLNEFERAKLQYHTPKVQQKGLTLRVDPTIEFFSPDGLRTIHRLFGGQGTSEAEHVNAMTAYAASAYMYVAVRYRMRKIAEAPLIVVQEDRTTGQHEWLPDHLLAGVLADPSPDFDGNLLLQRTVAYKDITGMALWRKVANAGGRPGRLLPFNGWEFTPERTSSRIYGKFRLDTDKGPEYLEPEEVVFFQEPNPLDWHNGVSKVDVTLGWLNLGQQARATVVDILRNGLFPSVIAQADPDWNPNEEEWELFKQQLDEYSNREQRGGPLALLGGGNATRVSLTLRDLIPSDILDRVESVVASTFGIPSVVLQYEVGIKNSPWSQMKEARDMAYQDTIEPEWREMESAITRQLLWAPLAPNRAPLEADRGKIVVFDTSRVKALQRDLVVMTAVAKQMGEDASLNERRMLMGLDPKPEPEADLVPALEKLLAPKPPPADPGAFANPFALPPADEDAEDDQEAAQEEEDVAAARRLALSRKGGPGGAAAGLPFTRRPPMLNSRSNVVPSRPPRNGKGP